MALKGLRSFVQELVTIYLLLSKVYEHLEEVKDNYNCVCVCVCVRACVRACVHACVRVCVHVHTISATYSYTTHLF